jgi:hypothetical protein
MGKMKEIALMTDQYEQYEQEENESPLMLELIDELYKARKRNKLLTEVIELQKEKISFEKEKYDVLQQLHDSFISKFNV